MTILRRLVESQAELLPLPVAQPCLAHEHRAGARGPDAGGHLGLPVAAGREVPHVEPRLDARLLQGARDPLNGRFVARAVGQEDAKSSIAHLRGGHFGCGRFRRVVHAAAPLFDGA